MKNFNFLSVVIALVLMVTAVSCMTPQGGYNDDYYTTNDRRAPNRVYVDDPYYGTIVLERDPYSGRYYQVSPYGYSYGYNNRYDRRYDNRYRDNYYYRRNQGNNSGNNQQQTEQQRKDWEKKREEARKKVLGG